MIDTVNLKLVDYSEGANFLERTPLYLDEGNLAEHRYPDGVTVSSTLGNFKVYVSKNQVIIKDGSLCKWFLGDNYQTLTRGDVQRAFEKMGDILHLPIGRAVVTRVDVATNIIVDNPVTTYFSYMGDKPHTQRLLQPNSLYYSTSKQVLCLYDKNRQTGKGNVPELYRERNVLRIEQRYVRNIPRQTRVQAVTAATLYQEPFYIELLENWHKSYRDIRKTNEIKLNFASMKTIRDLNNIAVLNLVMTWGGEIAFCTKIGEAQKGGEISRKQAHDLKQRVKNVCKLGNGFTVPSGAIAELDKKVSLAVKNYR